MGIRFSIKIKSKPKPRQRVVYGAKRTYAYYPKAYQEYEKELYYKLKQLKVNYDFNEPFTLNINITPNVISFSVNRVKGERSVRGDIDNHIKAILDTMQKVFKFNDKNCYEIKCKIYKEI